MSETPGDTHKGLLDYGFAVGMFLMGMIARWFPRHRKELKAEDQKQEFEERKSRKYDSDMAGHYIEGDADIRDTFRELLKDARERIQQLEEEVKSMKDAMFEQSVRHKEEGVKREKDHADEVEMWQARYGDLEKRHEALIKKLECA